MHKTLCLVPGLALKRPWCFTRAIPVWRRLRQKDQKFKVNLSYVASWRPAWETRNFVSKKKKKHFSFMTQTSPYMANFEKKDFKKETRELEMPSNHFRGCW